MNRPSFRIDKINPLGSMQNKIFSRITRMEVRHFGGNHIEIISTPDPRQQKYIVKREVLDKFFKSNNVTHVYINETAEKREDNSYIFGGICIKDKANVVVNCVIGS